MKSRKRVRIAPRTAVRWFAECMELTLRQNDYKSGWDGCTFRYLAYRLQQEFGELRRAHAKMGKLIYKPGECEAREQVIREATDVANFAMMIADNERFCIESERERTRKRAAEELKYSPNGATP